VFDYERPLFLPSGGLEYDKIIYIRPPKLNYFALINDGFFGTSVLEKQVAFLKNHISIDPLKLFTADFYYIYAHYFLEISKQDDFQKYEFCFSCGEQNLISAHLGEIPEIVYLDVGVNPDHGIRVWEVQTPENKVIRVLYRQRKIIDNISFGTMEFAGKEKDSHLDKYFLFCSHQIVNAYYDGEEISVKQLKTALSYSSGTTQGNIYNLYKNLKERKFGMKDEFEFTCAHCGKLNHVNLWDDLAFSFYSKAEQEVKNLEDYYEKIIHQTRMQYTDISSIANLPISHFEPFLAAGKKVGIDHIVARVSK